MIEQEGLNELAHGPSAADQLILSRAIVGELLEVLARKFARDREELARVAVFLGDLAEL